MSEKLMTALYQKMNDEQGKFRDWLLTQPQEEVLNNAYKYATREDILLEVGEMELSDEKAKALLKSPTPLADIYREWEKRDSCDYMDDIRDTIEARADDVLTADREKRGKER